MRSEETKHGFLDDCFILYHVSLLWTNNEFTAFFFVSSFFFFGANNLTLQSSNFSSSLSLISFSSHFSENFLKNVLVSLSDTRIYCDSYYWHVFLSSHSILLSLFSLSLSLSFSLFLSSWEENEMNEYICVGNACMKLASDPIPESCQHYIYISHSVMMNI